MGEILEGLKAVARIAGKVILEGAKLGAEISYGTAKALGKGTKEVVKETAKGAAEGAKMAGKVILGDD